MRAALEVLLIILRALERFVNVSRQKQKQEQINDAYEDPEQFFDTHFNGHGDRVHEFSESNPGTSGETSNINSPE